MTRLRLSAMPALLAAAAMTATPAQAAPLAPVAAAPAYAAPLAWDSAEDATAYHRRYRTRRGPSAGDVLTGVLIIGAIATIANATRGNRDERARDRDWRYPDARPDYRRDDARYDDRYRDDARGIDRAVAMCVDAVERDARVESVDSVDRNARGWMVTGLLAGGRSFTCAIGADGRIENIDYDGRARYDNEDDDGYRYGAGYEAGEDRQYDDARYADAWARVDAGEMSAPPAVPAASQTGPQPAYPGGPLPGEEDIDADLDS